MNNHFTIKTRLIRLIEKETNLCFEKDFFNETKINDLNVGDDFQLILEDEFNMCLDLYNSFFENNDLTVKELIDYIVSEKDY